MKTLISLYFIFLCSTAGIAQFSMNFDQDVATLSSSCWVLSQINYTTTTGEVINGTGSIYTNPPTNSSGERSVATPFLNMSSTSLNVSFLYKTSNKIAGNATRTLNIGIVNNSGVFTSLQILTMDKNSPTSVLSHNATYTIATGVYRLEIRIGGTTGDGNSRIILDDINVSASPQYGAANSCNQSATAVNDTYNTAAMTPTTGNVLTNDQIPADNEIYTPTLVSAPASGTVVLNADGSFTYTPAALFTGGMISFTYQITDNGYPAATSNTATVNISYPALATLPVQLVGFNGVERNNNAELSWEVKDAHEGDYFEVEKSVDGKNFKVIGKVYANVHVSRHEYSDYQFTGAAYYRLKIVNLDLTVEHSKTIALKKSGNKVGFTVAGTLVAGVLKLSVEQSAAIKSFQIYSISGGQVMDVQYAANGSSQQINVQSLSSGMYVVSAVTNAGRQSSRFIKN